MSGAQSASRRRRLALALLVELVNQADDERVEELLAIALQARGRREAGNGPEGAERSTAPLYAGAWRPGCGWGDAPGYEKVSERNPDARA